MQNVPVFGFLLMCIHCVPIIWICKYVVCTAHDHRNSSADTHSPATPTFILIQPPSQPEFMAMVASKIPGQWDTFGVLLGIRQEDLNSFRREFQGNPPMCWGSIFSCWERKTPSPFTWQTVINILRSDFLSQRVLADSLHATLTGGN